MPDRPAPPSATTTPLDRRVAIAGGIVLGGLGLLAVAILGLAISWGGAGQAAPAANPAEFTYAQPAEAPALELTDQDGRRTA